MERRQPLLHRLGEAGARVGTRPPRSKRVRLALQVGLAALIFGFLVLTVVDQWSEIKDEGVHFHVWWLIPAFIVLPAFYAFNALGWDLIRSTRTLSDIVNRNVPDHGLPYAITMTRPEWRRV